MFLLKILRFFPGTGWEQVCSQTPFSSSSQRQRGCELHNEGDRHSHQQSRQAGDGKGEYRKLQRSNLDEQTEWAGRCKNRQNAIQEMGWAMKALVWRSIKLFSKRGEHHHRSGEEEPLVERRKEAPSLSLSLSLSLSPSIMESESECFITQIVCLVEILLSVLDTASWRKYSQNKCSKFQKPL